MKCFSTFSEMWSSGCYKITSICTFFVTNKSAAEAGLITDQHMIKTRRMLVKNEVKWPREYNEWWGLVHQWVLMVQTYSKMTIPRDSTETAGASELGVVFILSFKSLIHTSGNINAWIQLSQDCLSHTGVWDKVPVFTSLNPVLTSEVTREEAVDVCWCEVTVTVLFVQIESFSEAAGNAAVQFPVIHHGKKTRIFKSSNVVTKCNIKTSRKHCVSLYFKCAHSGRRDGGHAGSCCTRPIYLSAWTLRAM